MVQPGSPLGKGLSPKHERLGSWLTPLCLFVAACMLYFIRLGNSPLVGDELIYAIISQEIVTSGDWLHLTFRSVPYFDKPPLRLWMEALLFKNVGVSAWTARFWEALSAVLLVLVIYRFGRAFWSARHGLVAAMIFLTFNSFVTGVPGYGARAGALDSSFLLVSTAGVYLMWRAWSVGLRRPLYGGAILLSLAFLVKHASAMPLLVVGLLPYLTQPRKHLQTLAIAAGVFLIMPLAWLLSLHGDELVSNVNGEVIYRYLGYGSGLSKEGSGLTRNAWFLMVAWTPWHWLALPAIVWASWRVVTQRCGVDALLLAWVVLTALVYGLAKETSPHYFYSTLPALALLIASFLCAVYQRWSLDSRWPRVAMYGFGLLCGVFYVQSLYHHMSSREPPLIKIVRHFESNPALTLVSAIPDWQLSGFDYFHINLLPRLEKVSTLQEAARRLDGSKAVGVLVRATEAKKLMKLGNMHDLKGVIIRAIRRGLAQEFVDEVLVQKKTVQWYYPVVDRHVTLDMDGIHKASDVPPERVKLALSGMDMDKILILSPGVSLEGAIELRTNPELLEPSPMELAIMEWQQRVLAQMGVDQ